MQILALLLVSSVTLDKFFALSVYMKHEGNIALICKGVKTIDL